MKSLNATLNQAKKLDWSDAGGLKRLHTFRSHVVMLNNDGKRLIVVLANGKVYRSNEKLTRWYRMYPDQEATA